MSEPNATSVNHTQPTVTVFFAADETYAPYLSVAITSLLAHSNPLRRYHIIVLERGMSHEHQHQLAGLSQPNATVEMCHISDKINDLVNSDNNTLVADYKTTTLYFRLFIPELFPDIDRAIYLDTDTVITDDVAQLYDIDLQGNLMGAVHDQTMDVQEALIRYCQAEHGFDTRRYINSGVLLMDCERLREINFVQQFAELLNTYHPELAAVDQDYINAMLHDSLLLLDPRFNVLSANGPDDVADPCIIHFNLFNKPWNYPDALRADIWWKYAAQSPNYEELLLRLQNFPPINRELDELKKGRLMNQAWAIVDHADPTFASLIKAGVQVRVKM